MFHSIRGGKLEARWCKELTPRHVFPEKLASEGESTLMYTLLHTVPAVTGGFKA